MSHGSQLPVCLSSFSIMEDGGQEEERKRGEREGMQGDKQAMWVGGIRVTDRKLEDGEEKT